MSQQHCLSADGNMLFFSKLFRWESNLPLSHSQEMLPLLREGQKLLQRAGISRSAYGH